MAVLRARRDCPLPSVVLWPRGILSQVRSGPQPVTLHRDSCWGRCLLPEGGDENLFALILSW